MKKSLIKVIIALVLFTVIIAVAQNGMTPNISDSKSNGIWTGEAKHVDNIIQKDEKSLNSWLSLYNSWYFKKVEIEDWVNLKWYILSGSEEKIRFFLYEGKELWIIIFW